MSVEYIAPQETDVEPSTAQFTRELAVSAVRLELVSNELANNDTETAAETLIRLAAQLEADSLTKRSLAFIGNITQLDRLSVIKMGLRKEHAPKIAQALTRLYKPEIPEDQLLEDAKFLTLYLEGATPFEIAEQLGLSESSIKKFVQRRKTKIIDASLEQNVHLGEYITSALASPVSSWTFSEEKPVSKPVEAVQQQQIVNLPSAMELDEDNNRWDFLALCKDKDLEIFFPEKENKVTTERAKKICRDCSVIRQCLEKALEYDFQAGVYGGLDSKERRALLRSRGRKPTY